MMFLSIKAIAVNLSTRPQGVMPASEVNTEGIHDLSKTDNLLLYDFFFVKDCVKRL